MSIATAIQNAQQRVANAYDAIEAKGGTLPATQNLSNMPTAIASIPSGGTDNLPAFVSTGISSFTDNTITSIRKYAFYYMDGSVTNRLTSVSCSNVAEVKEAAFASCNYLTTVNLPSCTYIENSCFSYCSNLTNLTLSNQLTSIGNSAFWGCQNLASTINLPSSLLTLGTRAFDSCGALSVINYNAPRIANYNASGTSGIQSSNAPFGGVGRNASSLTFNIGNSVEYIPAYLLAPTGNHVSDQIYVTELNIQDDNNITKIGAGSFCGIKSTINNLNLVFPSITSITETMQYAFYDVDTLISVSLQNLESITVTNGMANTFSGCGNLESVNLNSLTTLSKPQSFYNAFSGCSSLTSVDLSSLASIQTSSCFYNAFYGCTSLTTLSFPALTSTSFGSYTNQFSGMLSGVTGCTVHFPSNLQSVIGGWSDVTAGFGGTNTTILFDLPATS